MTRKEVKQFFLNQVFIGSGAWKEDIYGNLKRKINNKDAVQEEYRIKFNKKSMRYEVRVGDKWIKMKTGFYKRLSVCSSKPHKLLGMK